MMYAQWEIDEDAWLDYEVHYFYNGIENEDLQTRLSVHLLTPVVYNVPLQPKNGYKLAATPYNPLLPATITETENAIKVYYVIDEEQTLGYRVEYYYNGIIDDTLTENESVLVASPMVYSVTDKSKAGYKLAAVPYEPTLPATITETDNVIKVYYVTDEEQTLSYTVEYREGSLTGKELKTKKTVTNVILGQICDETAEQFTGYTVDKTQKSITITLNDNKIVFIYTKTAVEPSGGGGGGGSFEEDAEDEIEDAETPATDIPEDESKPLDYLEIDEHRVYIQGYPDNTVRPDNGITRAEMATIFYRLLKKTYQHRDEETAFVDTSSDAWYSMAVTSLAELGIITGYEDGSFKPDNQITRAEFAVVASRFAKLSYTTGIAFNDVPSTHWAAKDISSAFVKGWINGYSDGTYLPNRRITRAEVAKIINVMLRRLPVKLPETFLNPFTDINNEYWAYIHIMEASTIHEYERGDKGIEYWTMHICPVTTTKYTML
jgi:hypothetical protein